MSEKFWLTVFAIVTIVCWTKTEAAVYMQRNAYHPSYPGKCFDRITQRPILPNKEYKPKGICATMTCDITTYTITVETCCTAEAPGCKELSIDPAWTFPKCCPRFSCTDEKTGQTAILEA